MREGTAVCVALREPVSKGMDVGTGDSVDVGDEIRVRVRVRSLVPLSVRERVREPVAVGELVGEDEEDGSEKNTSRSVPCMF